MNGVRTSTGVSEFRRKMSEFRREKIWPKDLISPRYGSKPRFSLDVISLLVSQFDLQKKKYCISLHLVVCTGKLLIRSLHLRVVYSSRAVYSSTSLSDPIALTSRVKTPQYKQFRLSTKVKRGAISQLGTKKRVHCPS